MDNSFVILPRFGVVELQQEYRELPDGRLACYSRRKETEESGAVTYSEWEALSYISGGPDLLMIAASCGQPVKRLESPWERAKAAARRYFWRG